MRTDQHLNLFGEIDHRELLITMLLASFVAPLRRLDELPILVKVLGPLVTVVLTALGADLYVILTMFGAVSSAHLDWWVGSVVAKKMKKFDGEKGRWGYYSKMVGVILMVMLFGLEYLLKGIGTDTSRIFTAVMGLGLILDDMYSLDRHRQALGGRPFPLLSFILFRIRKASEALLPDPALSLRRRKDDLEEENGTD